MSKAIALTILAVTIAFVPVAALCASFTPAQIEQAKTIRTAMERQGTREVTGSGVWYTWHANWYAMAYDRQYRTIRIIADAEYVASSGRITHMHIIYAGEEVAKATPTGGIKVIKSRP